ncbi:hydrogenase, partial [Candidatus Sumerlaeota bacterium]|nr:hydrogenase [Candidatus Sumerlaeota bacterium]
LVRITTLLPDPPVAWGVLLLVLGAVSGVLGVAFAIGQHDLKRLLAYHSVENIGIIVMGLGVAMIGRSLGRMDWMALGLAGCLLHVWNHGLFKSLLFLCAGSVLHATQTREMDQLGGLAKRMPWTAALFLVGALAICGLPPLNGFVSELFIYLGLFRGLGIGGGPPSTCAALAVPVLAIIGSLAVACFVKAYGTVFLGMARGRGPHEAHESPLSMIGPMGVLAICCALIGFAPLAVAPMLDRAVASWSMQPKGSEIKLESLAPLTWITAAGMILASVAGGAGLILRSGATRRSVSRPGTWDCGYAAPTPRMQYTSSSFAQALVGLFRWILRPRIHQPELSATFLPALHFSSHVDDFVLDGQIIPFARRAGRWLGRLRGLQQGVTQHYVLSILMTVIVLLAWTMPIEEWITQMFAR